MLKFNFLSAQPLAGTSKGVENTIVSVCYKRLVTKIIGRFSWLRAQENLALYNDVRALMNYVKTVHGAIFRRVVLSAMLESTQKIVKTQCKVDQGSMW